MDAREGSPPGISIKSLSYIRMFSDSALKEENAICLPMLQDPLDPVELGAIGKVGLVGDDKCEREEGGDGSRLFCPSHTFKFKLKCEGCLCCTWRILPPYPIPPGHRMTQANRKGPWLWPPADVSFSVSRTLLLPA